MSMHERKGATDIATPNRASESAGDVVLTIDDASRGSRWLRLVNAFTVVRPNEFGDVLTSPAMVRRPFWPLITFTLLVIVPSLCAQIYLAFLASDQYVAEARFAVRTADVESPIEKLTSKLNVASSLILSSSSQHAYIVSNYIRSRAMIDDIAPFVNLQEIFRRPEADFWARLRKDATAEELSDYWSDMVSAYVDAPSGIVKLQVTAFRKEDAVSVAKAVIKLSEKLVNDLSVRAREDATRLAEQEVRRADGLVQASLADLRSYRNAEGFIDPVKTADATGKLLGQLLAEKIQLESNYFVAIRSLSKDAPTVQNLRNRLDSIEIQINDLRGQLTGKATQSRNVAAALSRFEELELRRQFAEKMYSLAQEGLERARATALRQSVYLTTFVAPTNPEEAAYPRRFAYSIVIPIILAVFWGIGTLIAASIDDHRV